MFFFFFFQAEDGIRGGTVTGVQTCALPISLAQWHRSAPGRSAIPCRRTGGRCRARALPFYESSRSLCRHSSPVQCRFYREDAAEEQASAQERGTLEPYRIAKSPACGCRPE